MELILAQNEQYKIVFAPRSVLEEDPQFRQIIPYILLKNEEGKYALFQRYKGNEKRLAGKKTIGIGGHVDLSDLFSIKDYKEKTNLNEYSEEHLVEDIVKEAMKREVREEIGYYSSFFDDFSLIGKIRIDDSPVDRVHLGFVYELNIKSTTFFNCFDSVKEKELVFIGFKNKNELMNEENLENWSLFVLNNII